MTEAELRKRIAHLREANATAEEQLNELLRSVEATSRSGMLASILILDKDAGRLRHGAAPSLPAEYNAAIDGVEIGPQVGSCGTAAYLDRTVVVYDIANDPLWSNFRDLALTHQLRACWSTPIHHPDGSILGTFANYYTVVRDPSPIDQTHTEIVKNIAADIIECGKQNEHPAAG